MQENKKYTILTVDDVLENIDIVKGILATEYLVQAATSGQMALDIIEKSIPDLILLDIMMPDMDGYEVCKALKLQRRTKDIPIIFLTAKSECHDEEFGLSIGASDYISKPFIPAILKARVNNQLMLKESRDLLARQNEVLEEKVQIRTSQLTELQDVAMVAMGALAESRDPETGNHIRRTQHYVRVLAQELANYPQYEETLTPETITSLYKSAPLHDIGKVGVPDYILLKPGKLTDEEFEAMKLHTVYGRDALVAAEKEIDTADNFLKFAKEIAYSHQEKWDGSGYPEGLSGEDIPLSARLMAVADVYDALISKRVYKPAFSHEKAFGIIVEGKGSHFDPILVDCFVAVADKFAQIAKQFADADDDIQ